MGKAKSHHYVPQFYLRRFSDDDRSIRLLHKASGRIIEGASIKGQCAIDDFHGWHEHAETSIATIEGACAVSIDRLIQREAPPPRDSADFSNLLLFVSLQSVRTEQSAEINNALTDKFMKMMAQGQPEFENIDFDKFVIKETYPVAMPMAVGLQAFDHLRNLEMKVLVAGGSWGFTTSDNPVVRYNSSRADVWWEGVIGLDCEGLQIFLPLSRKVCLYLFDPIAYGSAANTPSRVLGLEDVLKVNSLSILNSSRNLYGHTKSDLEVAATLRELTRPLENFPRVAFVETESYESGEEQTASLIATYNVQAPAKFSFRFARHRQVAPREGIRSDRLASERRKTIGTSSTARSLRVVESTISEPRALLESLPVERLARTLRTSLRAGEIAPPLTITRSRGTSRDRKRTPGDPNRVAAEALG